jgi:hypothetical protein
MWMHLHGKEAAHVFRRWSLRVFPTLIWTFQVEPEERPGLNAALGTEITQLIGDRSTSPAGCTWQTYQNLNDNPVFAPPAQMIRGAALNVLADLEVKN